MDIPLTATASVTLNASGNGTIEFGPSRSRDSWRIDSVSVNVSTRVKEAQCKIYAGLGAMQSTFVDSTFTASSGDTTDAVNKTIRAGEKLTAVLTGGDAGAVASVNVYGTQTVQ